jgi:hypothetical protein
MHPGKVHRRYRLEPNYLFLANLFEKNLKETLLFLEQTPEFNLKSPCAVK